MHSKLLILDPDPDPDNGMNYTRLLGSPELLIEFHQTGLDGLKSIRRQSPDLLLLDLQLQDMRAADFLFRAEEMGNCPPFAILTDKCQIEQAVDWMKRGALDVILRQRTWDSSLAGRIEQLIAKADSSKQIREAKRSGKQRERNRDKLLGGIPALLLMFDEHGELVLANRSAERKGMSAAALQRQDAFAPGGWRPPLQLLEGFESTLRREQEWDGLLYEATWVRSGSHVICLAQELGPRRIEERSRRQLERGRILSQKMEAMGQVAGHLGHDVSNQLLVIMGYTDLLRETLQDTPGAAKWVDAIRQAAESVGSQVRRLLAFTRGRKHSYTDVDAHAMIRKVAQAVRVDFPMLRIALDAQARTPAILGDESMLEEAMEAVLRNGAEAMKGEGVLRITTQNLHPGQFEEQAESGPEAGSGATHLQIQVQDSGPGMSEDVLERIFDPFFTTRKQEGGHGLGLAMAWGCIRSHNGRISANSRPGAGSSIHILLPLFVSGVRDLEERGGLKGHVLLVDDDEVVRGVVRTILRSLGCQVSAFGGGAAALEWFENEHQPVDLALLDLRMPGMNGWELLRRLRQRDPNLRALLLTAWADSYERDEESMKAVLGILHKPFELDDLYAHISSALTAVRKRRSDSASPVGTPGS